MIDALLAVVVYSVVIASAWGLIFWTKHAEKDRSAIVGLYLLLGAPAALLTVAGIAFAVFGQPDGVVFLAIGLAIGLPLARRLRELFARFTPLDPASPTDMVGLATLLPILAVITVNAIRYQLPTDSDDVASIDYFDLIAQNAFFVGLAYACVGVGIRRGWGEATGRLGLRWPGWTGIAVAVGAVVAGLVFGQIAGVLTEVLQPEYAEEINEFTGELTENLPGLGGAIVIGLATGIGEETLLRGAVQPRFGIVLTALFFALLHTQYGLSYTILGLFAVGLLLGWERQRYGTVAAIITHSLYNFIVVLISNLS